MIKKVTALEKEKIKEQFDLFPSYNIIGSLTKTVTTDFTYDNAGRLYDTAVEFEIKGQLTKLTPKGGGKSINISKKNGKIDPTIISEKDSVYAYDADGIRTTKYTYNEDVKETVSLEETDIENIVDDPNNESSLIDVLQPNLFPNVIETQYFYLGDSILFTADINGYKLTENVLDPWGETVVSKRYEEIVETDNNDEEVIVDWNIYYFTLNTDIRGSVTNIVRPDGSLATGYIYDEFGNQIKTGDEDFLNEATYTGAIFDPETELTYMNARYYDSSSGRFISQDSYRGSLSSPQTQHLYSYTSNNPINFIDPTGHQQHNANGGGSTLGTKLTITAQVTGKKDNKPSIDNLPGTFYNTNNNYPKSNMPDEYKPSDIAKVIDVGLSALSNYAKYADDVAPIVNTAAKVSPFTTMIVGVGIDYFVDGKTIGVSIAHTGVGMLIGSAAGVAVMALIKVGVITVASPAVAVVVAGLTAGAMYEYAYTNNFLGAKTFVDWIGNNINISITSPKVYNKKCYGWQKGSYKMSYGC